MNLKNISEEDLELLRALDDEKNEEEKINIIKKLHGNPEKGITADDLKIFAVGKLTDAAKLLAIDKLQITDIFIIFNIIQNFQDGFSSKLLTDELRLSLIDQLDKLYDMQAEIIETLQGDSEKGISADEAKLSVLYKLTNERNIARVIKSLEGNPEKNITADEAKISALDMLNSDEYIIEIIKTLKGSPEKGITASESKISALKYLWSTESRKKIIFSLEDIEKDRKIDTYIEYCSGKKLTEDEFAEKKEILTDCMSRNSELISTINLDFLDKKYIEVLGQQHYEQLACYSNAQEQICELNGNELKLFELCYTSFIERNGESQWNIFTSKILDKLASNQYRRLVTNIMKSGTQLDESDLENLGAILTADNIFNIKSIEDVRNYNQIKQDVCEAILNNDEEKLTVYPKIKRLNSVDRKKLAILETLFGIDTAEAQRIIDTYGEDIDKITVDNDVATKTSVAYVNCLKRIVNETDEEKIDAQIEIVKNMQEKIETVEPIAMEGEIKRAYFREYKKGLFAVENAKKLDGKNIFGEGQDGENIYDAGVDFRILGTSFGPYARADNPPKNFEKEWNVNLKAAQGICCSYISNEMMGTALMPFCFLGFNTVQDDSLMLSGPRDIDSKTKKLVPSSQENHFHTPQEQINKTDEYNEMVIARNEAEGEKVQPDYIVAFKKNGEIQNKEAIKQVQRDFGGIPIVLIDVDKCLANEEIKIYEMIQAYAKDEQEWTAEERKMFGSSEDLKTAIMQKVRNNDQTTFSNATSGCKREKDFKSKIPNEFGENNMESFLANPSKIDLSKVGQKLEQLKTDFKAKYPEETQIGLVSAKVRIRSI